MSGPPFCTQGERPREQRGGRNPVGDRQEQTRWRRPVVGGLILLVIVGLGFAVLGGHHGPVPAGAENLSERDDGYPGERVIDRTPFTTLFRDELQTSAEQRRTNVTRIDIRDNTVFTTVTGQGPRFEAVIDLRDAFAAALARSWANETHTWGIDHAVVRYVPSSGGANRTWRIDEWWIHHWQTGALTQADVLRRIEATGDRRQAFDDAAFETAVRDIDGVTIDSVERYGRAVFLSGNRSAENTLRDGLLAIERAAFEADSEDIRQLVIFARFGDGNTNGTVYQKFGTGYIRWENEGSITRAQHRSALTLLNHSASAVPGPVQTYTTRPLPT